MQANAAVPYLSAQLPRWARRIFGAPERERVPGRKKRSAINAVIGQIIRELLSGVARVWRGLILLSCERPVVRELYLRNKKPRVCPG